MGRGARSVLLALLLVPVTATPGEAAAGVVDCTTASLQAAIDAAASGDSITFTGTCREHVTIDKSLTVQGSGSAVIDGSAGPGTVLTVPAGAAIVAMSGFTVTGGNAVAQGGGVFVGSGVRLTLTNVTVSGNRAGAGAGLANFGYTTVKDSVVRGNEATGNGGGFYSEGRAYIDGAVFESNTAANGGGIWVEADPAFAFSVNNSVISGNTALGNGGGVGSPVMVRIEESLVVANEADFGGGVYADGALINGDVFFGNVAAESGGAVYGVGSSRGIAVSRSQFVANSATRSGGAIASFGLTGILASELAGNTAGEGGAVYVGGTANLSLRDSSVTSNVAATSGGGVWAAATVSLANTTVYDNEAPVGGGLYAQEGPLNITLSTVASNNATTRGGGIRVAGTSPGSLTGSILASNTGPDGPDCSGPLTSQGYSVVGSAAGCGFSAAGSDAVGADARLDPPRTGWNETTILMPGTGSPALNRVPSSSCPEQKDQQGYQRPQGAACEAGALERPDTDIGLVDTSSGLWRMFPILEFYFGVPGDLPFLGDWDCDGVDTPGTYRQSTGFVYLGKSNTTSAGDISFFLGDPGDIPLAGDFDGDGCDTVSVYRPSQGRVYISNVLGKNDGYFSAQFDYFFGVPGDRPFAGDFDGDGKTSVGLYRESTGFVYFRNGRTTGVADASFFYGEPSDRIIAGDWDGNGTETVGIFRPRSGFLYLSNENVQKTADKSFYFGPGPWIPVTGAFS